MSLWLSSLEDEMKSLLSGQQELPAAAAEPTQRFTAVVPGAHERPLSTVSTVSAGALVGDSSTFVDPMIWGTNEVSLYVRVWGLSECVGVAARCAGGIVACIDWNGEIWIHIQLA
jgi:hypothetical protein